jgi:hypothetical protein
MGLWGNLEHSIFSWNKLSECQTGINVGSFNEIFANSLLDMVKYEGSGKGVVAHHGTGIQAGLNNTLYGNNFTGNGLGLGLDSNNSLYGNNFVNNSHDVGSYSASNVWDNGTFGNFWGDYFARYPDAKEVDSSGTGDMPYVIGANNTDYHPLLKPISVEQALAIMPPQATPEPTPTPSPFSTTWIVTIVTIAAVIIAAGVIAYSMKKRRVK